MHQFELKGFALYKQKEWGMMALFLFFDTVRLHFFRKGLLSRNFLAYLLLDATRADSLQRLQIVYYECEFVFT